MSRPDPSKTARPTSRPLRSRARPLAASLPWALAAVLAQAALPAGATTHFTRVVAGALSLEDPNGGSLSLPGAEATASASAGQVSASAVNTTDWVGGPYVEGTARQSFGLAGAVGGFSLISVQVHITSNTTMGGAFDHNTNATFGASLRGDAIPFASAASGGITSVNCIGCGGLIELGSVNLDPDADGVVQSSSWTGAQNMTLTLNTRISQGVADAGLLELSVGGVANSGFVAGSIRVLSISDDLGNQYILPANGGFLQAVPEPASSALALAGLLLLAGRLRRPAGAR